MVLGASGRDLNSLATQGNGSQREVRPLLVLLYGSPVSEPVSKVCRKNEQSIYETPKAHARLASQGIRSKSKAIEYQTLRILHPHTFALPFPNAPLHHPLYLLDAITPPLL